MLATTLLEMALTSLLYQLAYCLLGKQLVEEKVHQTRRLTLAIS
jgi:hypothetical protein